MGKPDYDTSIGRMAGNIAAGVAQYFGRTETGQPWRIEHKEVIAAECVALARAIAAEVKRTERKAEG